MKDRQPAVNTRKTFNRYARYFITYIYIYFLYVYYIIRDELPISD